MLVTDGGIVVDGGSEELSEEAELAEELAGTDWLEPFSESTFDPMIGFPVAMVCCDSFSSVISIGSRLVRAV